MIAVLDYGRGNIFSLSRALEHVGADHVVTCDPDRLMDADGIVLPGVGAFRDAMNRLSERVLDEAIKTAAGRGVPLLGICLGMQLLFERSTEFGEHPGLGLIPGDVDRLPRGAPGAPRVRIPNVGWRKGSPRAPHPMTHALAPKDMVYFVHSYVPYPEDPRDILASLPINGIEAAVMVARGNVVGCQFHPERSGPVGLRILGAFVEATEARRPARRPAQATAQGRGPRIEQSQALVLHS